MNTTTQPPCAWHRFAGWSTLLSILACYGTMATLAGLSLLGIGVAVDEGVWAGVVVGLAMLAVACLGMGHRRHRRAMRLLAAVLGGALIAWVMFAAYHPVLELIGFALLAAATVHGAAIPRRRERLS